MELDNRVVLLAGALIEEVYLFRLQTMLHVVLVGTHIHARSSQFFVLTGVLFLRISSSECRIPGYDRPFQLNVAKLIRRDIAMIVVFCASMLLAFDTPSQEAVYLVIVA